MQEVMLVTSRLRQSLAQYLLFLGFD